MLTFELAYNLHLTVSDLYATMSYEEYVGWLDYLERRPVGWREDDRTFKYLQTQGVKAKPWEIFRSLNPIYNPVSEEVEKPGFMSVASIKASAIFSQMLSAKGGAKFDLE